LWRRRIRLVIEDSESGEGNVYDHLHGNGFDDVFDYGAVVILAGY
jgi:hypothetical protein